MVQKEKLEASGYGKTYQVRAKIWQRIKGQASWHYLEHNGTFVFDNIFFNKKDISCFGINGPLKQYFSLYRAVSLKKRGRKKKEMIDERKNVQTTSTRTYKKRSRPLPYSNPKQKDAPALEVYPAPSHHPTTPSINELYPLRTPWKCINHKRSFLWFLFSANCPMKLYMCSKFHENFDDRFKVIEWIQFWN